MGARRRLLEETEGTPSKRKKSISYVHNIQILCTFIWIHAWNAFRWAKFFCFCVAPNFLLTSCTSPPISRVSWKFSIETSVIDK